jgi:hypothetical protein
MLQGSPQDGEVFGELALFRFNDQDDVDAA